jgi:hypothetical protein
MSVYKKLQSARIALQGRKLSKSGKNKFAGYEYFELGDFLPAIQDICNEVGLCGVVTFTTEMAYLTIFDVESEGAIVFSSPMSTASLKGCHDVQNLGAVQTYLRRYLWTNAFEIVEHDALDATLGAEAPRAKVEPKPESKPEPKPQRIVGSGDWRMSAPPEPEGDPQEWVTLVTQASQISLGMAKTEDDVMSIYKNNRAIFDKYKELDAEAFKEMMDKFSETKAKLKEQ